MKLFLDPRAMVGAAALAVGAAFATSLGAGMGMGLGLVGTAFGFFVTRLGLAMMAHSAQGGAVSSAGASFVVILFLLKLPILVGLWMIAGRLHPDAPPSFLVGLGLVYCWAVGWAQAMQREGPH